MSIITTDATNREIMPNQARIVANVRGDYPKAQPIEVLQNKDELEISLKSQAISNILKIAKENPVKGFPQIIPELDKLFKSYDPDSADTPVDLGAIWYNKGGADVKAIRYIGYFVENEPKLAKEAIKAMGIEQFKKGLEAVYYALPVNEEAFSTQDEANVSRQLKEYLPK